MQANATVNKAVRVECASTGNGKYGCQAGMCKQWKQQEICKAGMCKYWNRQVRMSSLNLQAMETARKL